MPKTRLLYQLTHPAPVTCTSHLVSIAPSTAIPSNTTANSKSTNYEVVLDETVFYAQGGGQPSDTGTIQIIDNDNKHELEVQSVKHSDNNNIVHYCTGSATINNTVSSNASVQCTVNQEKRYYHCKLHSAGHLIDAAVERAKLNWKPSRAHHFPDGPYVEYSSAFNNQNEVLNAADLLQKHVDEMINEDLNISMKFAARSEVDAEELGVPEGVEEVRLITIGTFRDNPCGGTHVQSTKELVGTKVKKVSVKGESKIKVAYTI